MSQSKSLLEFFVPQCSLRVTTASQPESSPLCNEDDADGVSSGRQSNEPSQEADSLEGSANHSLSTSVEKSASQNSYQIQHLLELEQDRDDSSESLDVLQGFCKAT